MSPSGLHVNKPAVIIIIGLIGGFVIWFTIGKAPVSQAKLPDSHSSQPIVADSKNNQATMAESKVIKVGDGEVSYIEMTPKTAKFDVLFLHGQSFSAETWVSDPPRTLQLVHQLGYRAVAIDLPGKGKTSASSMDRGEYLGKVINALKLDKPVIISPSMSGSYSIPYLFKDPSSVLTRARGFVPVAPVSTQTEKDKYPEAKIPTLIIYGENDKIYGKNSVENLQSLPESKVTMISNAGHACYMNNPQQFNEALAAFLQGLH